MSLGLTRRATKGLPISAAEHDANLDAIECAIVDVRANSIGLSPDAYGTVTQQTSKSTAVTLDAMSGRITMHPATLGGGAGNNKVTFSLDNVHIGTNDVIVVNVASNGTPGAYTASICCVQNGQARITVINQSGNAKAEAVQLSFAVIKLGP